MKDVFISYAEEDASLVLKLAAALERHGFTTWCHERDGDPGPSYLVQTAKAIEQSHAFLLIISKESLGSHQITKEVVRAHEAAKPFVPVLVDVSHVEFQARQPEWKEAAGAATSIGLANRDLEDVFAAIRRGLHSLGVEPSGQTGPGLAHAATHNSPPQAAARNSTAAPAIDAGRLFDAARTSAAGKMVEALCSRMEEILAARPDRDSALRFLKMHLEAEMEDTEEGIASCENSKQDSMTPKTKDPNSALASVFGIMAFSTILGDLRKKKRALRAMLEELGSLANLQKAPREIVDALSDVARFYLK